MLYCQTIDLIYKHLLVMVWAHMVTTVQDRIDYPRQLSLHKKHHCVQLMVSVSNMDLMQLIQCYIVAFLVILLT